VEAAEEVGRLAGVVVGAADPLAMVCYRSRSRSPPPVRDASLMRLPLAVYQVARKRERQMTKERGLRHSVPRSYRCQVFDRVGFGVPPAHAVSRE
jgi:hypothetical protein